LLNERSDDFSFSGLKTSVRYYLRDHPEILNNPIATKNLCASVQAAIVDVLVAKTMRAAARLGVRCITASGGVTCNSGLRQRLIHDCQAANLTLRMAEPSLCTDNAAMIGILAERKLRLGCAATPLAAEIHPAWPLNLVLDCAAPAPAQG
jgi:N6-L-threonylcarbamoyladenine synthase